MKINTLKKWISTILIIALLVQPLAVAAKSDKVILSNKLEYQNDPDTPSIYTIENKKDLTKPEILLIQSVKPWGYDSNIQLLDKISLPYEVKTMEQAETINFNSYQLIMTANNQTEAYYNGLKRNREKMEAYVEQGGTLLYLIHDASEEVGHPDKELPGGVFVKESESSSYGHHYNYIMHPINSGAFTTLYHKRADMQIVGFNSFGVRSQESMMRYQSNERNKIYNYFAEESLPEETIVLYTGERSRPLLVEYPLGKGNILASVLPMEYKYKKDLENNEGSRYPSGTLLDDVVLYSYLSQALKEEKKQTLLGIERTLQGITCMDGEMVDVANGNFFYDKTDLTISGSAPIVFSRYYNSLGDWDRTLGKGWTHNFDAHLIKKKEDLIQITFEDGHTKNLYYINGLWSEPTKEFHKVEYDSESLTLYKPDGSKYCFNNKGQLVGKTDSMGNQYFLFYMGDKLIRVENQGNYLIFNYDGTKLVNVTGSTGKSIDYEYLNDVLISVAEFGNKYAHYYYDPTRKLVTISEDNRFIVKNTYDKANRIEMQETLGEGNYIFIYDDKNRTTTFRNKNGAETIYRKDDYNRVFVREYPSGEEYIEFNDCDQIISAITTSGEEYQYRYNCMGKVYQESTDDVWKTYEYRMVHDKLQMWCNRLDSNRQSDNYMYYYYYDSLDRLKSANEQWNGSMNIEYNEDNQPIRITHTDGSSIDAEYNEDEIIITMTDSEGEITQELYNEQALLKSEEDANGNVTQYEYTEDGKVKSILYADGSTFQYAYNEDGEVKEEIDELGRKTSYTYYEDGLLKTKKDSQGGITAYEYDLMGNTKKITYPDKSTIQNFYDLNNNLIKTIDEEGAINQFVYNQQGLLLSEIDPLGNEKTYEYDTKNRLISETDALGNKTKYEYEYNGQIGKITNPLGYTTEYSYSGDKLTSLRNEAGDSEYYSYNNYSTNGKLTTKRNSYGYPTYYDYDSRGNITTTTYANGSKEQVSYDSMGNLIWHKDVNGAETEYIYDSRNRLITVKNALGKIQNRKYTLTGKLSEITDENGNTTKYVYDSLDQLVEAIDANKNKTTYTYDNRGNLTEIHQFKSITKEIIDSMDKDTGKNHSSEIEEIITKYRYDKTGRLIEELKPSNKVKVFSYDGNGNLISAIDEDKNEIIYSYDTVQNLTQINYGVGQSINYEYNELKQLVSMTDWNGTTNYELDPLGRILKETDYENRTTEYKWNYLNKKTSITYPDGSIVKYNYDGMGNLTQVMDSSGGSTKYAYDIGGNLIETLLPNGIKTITEYDELQRVISLTDSRSDNSIINQYKYSYDNVGNKTKITRNRNLNAAEKLATDTEGETLYTYDAINQLTQAKYSNGKVEKYFYDTTGNRVQKETYNNGSEKAQIVDYKYNAINQLLCVNGAAEMIYGVQADSPVTMAYDDRGNLTSVKKGDKPIAEYKYNLQDRLSQAQNQYGMKSVYNYKGDGTRSYMSIEVPDLNQESKNPEESLPAVNLPDIENVEGVLTGASNENVNGYGTNLEMDGLGESDDNTSEPSNPIDATYKKEYHYISDSTSTNKNILMVYGENNNIQRYTYGINVVSSDTISESIKQWSTEITELLSDPNNSIKSYYLLDELGSTSKLVGKKEEVHASYTYNEFGTPLVSTHIEDISPMSNLHGYAGYEYDLGTGLYFVQARYYMPEVGRFVSEDMIKGHVLKPTSMNRYAYVWNNPIRYIDPDGKTAKDIITGLAASIAENASMGIVSWAIKHLYKNKGYNYESDHDYYLGRVAGDVISYFIGAGMASKGLLTTVGSFVAGGGVAAFSGGTLTLGGVQIIVSGVAVGSILIVAGGTTMTMAAVNLGDDYSKLMSIKNSSSTKGGSNTGGSKAKRAVDSLNDNKKNHILQDKHNWNKLVTNPKSPNSWVKISAIITKVMTEGKEEKYKSVLKKGLEVSGQTVEVTYKIINGEIKISDAWVK